MALLIKEATNSCTYLFYVGSYLRRLKVNRYHCLPWPPFKQTGRLLKYVS